MALLSAKKSKSTKSKTGHVLTLVLECDPIGQPSASGKTMVVASTKGNVQTDVKVDGQQVTVGVNAYYYPLKRNG